MNDLFPKFIQRKMAYNVVHCLNAINDIDDINKGQVAL
jgi:hypothetical protein